MIFSVKTRRAGVIGWPIEHSRSPRLHGFWLERHGIDGAYIPFAVPPGDLPAAFQGLKTLGFRGVNVTVPHKEAVFDLVDDVDPAARRIGAINTIVFDAQGRAQGRNTDGYGFLGARMPGRWWCLARVARRGRWWRRYLMQAAARSA
jgi:shikimate dehydrogenase